MILDGSTSRALIIVCVVVAIVALCWHGSLSGGEGFGGLMTIAGAVLHASGTKQGADAATPTEANS